MSDPYLLEKLALAPTVHPLSPGEIIKLLDDIYKIDEEKFLNLIIKNGLASIWFDFINEHEIYGKLSNSFVSILKNEKINTTALLLNESHELKQIHEIFELEKIPYLIFKGGSLKYTAYDDPAQRPTSDIDILVAEMDKHNAIAGLAKAGFDFYPLKENISHEATLTKKLVHIDLHWKLLRPGRTRIDLTDYFFQNRIKVDQYWGLNHQASLFVSLIHPAITKQLHSPSSILIHLVDLQKLVCKKEVNWDALVEIIEKSGTRSIAWASLYWLEKLTGTNAPEDIFSRLKPGRAHEHYIRIWLDHNLVKKLWKYYFLVQGGFSLAMQDSLPDALHALRTLMLEKKLAQGKMDELIAIYEKNRRPD
jgi:hypothetical protein